MKIVETYSENTASEIIEIISAQYLHDYKIDILFSDDSQKVVDFEPFLLKSIHPGITKYLDKTLFKDFILEDGDINWNNYDMIFPIADLHAGKVDRS